MRNEIANEIMNFGQKFRYSKNDSKDFCAPIATCRFLDDSVDQMEKICSSKMNGVTEMQATKLVIDRTEILGKLISVRTGNEIKEENSWNNKKDALMLFKIFYRIFKI